MFLKIFTSKLTTFITVTDSVLGEGNGTPLQYSCLENPMDGGAWWAAVYGVAQSQTQLKRLSSSSNSVLGFPGGAVVKNPPAGDAGDMGLIPGSGRSSGIRNGNLLQYPCLKNSINREGWQAIVHGVAQELDTTERLSVQLSPLIRSALFFAFLFSFFKF